jgi:hypothetical protein
MPAPRTPTLSPSRGVGHRLQRVPIHGPRPVKLPEFNAPTNSPCTLAGWASGRLRCLPLAVSSSGRPRRRRIDDAASPSTCVHGDGSAWRRHPLHVFARERIGSVSVESPRPPAPVPGWLLLLSPGCFAPLLMKAAVWFGELAGSNFRTTSAGS